MSHSRLKYKQIQFPLFVCLNCGQFSCDDTMMKQNLTPLVLGSPTGASMNGTSLIKILTRTGTMLARVIPYFTLYIFHMTHFLSWLISLFTHLKVQLTVFALQLITLNFLSKRMNQQDPHHLFTWYQPKWTQINW